MESKTPTPASPDLDLHPLPVEFHEIDTEICEESIIYSDVKIHCPNIQKQEKTRILKTKESPWCLTAFVFAFLYLIVLVIAAIMIAKVKYLEEILKSEESNNQNETAHCKML